MKPQLKTACSNRLLSAIIVILFTLTAGFTAEAVARGGGGGGDVSDNPVSLKDLLGIFNNSDDSGSGPTVPKNRFNILMNYELGMHCTGFEFSYCCVLPPYNSILAQVVRTQKGFLGANAFPTLLEGDPNVGKDFLGRPTVLRDTKLDSHGNFKKYVLRYWHDAQPRNDGRGAAQTSTLISQVEGNSLLMWNTRFDAADTTGGNALIYDDYGSTFPAAAATNLCVAGNVGAACSAHSQCDTSPGAKDGLCDLYGHQNASPKNHVLQGNGSYADPEDNYANAWLNHLYIYQDLEGSNPTANVSAEKDKIRLGLRNQNASTAFATVVPQNSGPAFHPMGPGSTPGLNNVLTFSGDSGTVVYTQMKVLENLPVMLTSPRIWEALGLPLDPFEDTINFFGDPGKIDESTLRPYVRMNAALHNYDPSQPGGIGTAVLQDGNPVVGMGDAPIDIPNCERCHSSQAASPNNANNPSGGTTDAYRPATAAKVQLEYDFWNAYYNIDTVAGDSDWYSRLKAAAISILSIHDNEHRTDFTANYPVIGGGTPAVTRLGHESVLCQRCHADNVIAVVKSADTSRGLIPPLTEAIHNNHKDVVFDDSLGRNGNCQGCHPAHRSDGDMSNYPITESGDNAYASSDNRDAAGGCFVGRDVHSNPGRLADLSANPHPNAIGTWLRQNVANDTGQDKGIWCTNCHSQLSQEIWAKENMIDLIRGVPGKEADGTTDAVNIRALPSLGAIASAIGVTQAQAEAWLDPKFSNDDTAAIWNDAVDYPDAGVATVEANLNPACSAGRIPVFLAKYGAYACVSLDVDGDPSVRAMDFCTTPDCLAAAQATLNAEGNGSIAFPAQFSDATDGRDHWLAPGEPHCADCHAAPYTEQSGNINAFPPFNYPRKASLFRYSRGHQDITCQGCHESTHGLYPVTPSVDTTTYEQAARMNPDGKHGPLKCGACHIANSNGVPFAVNNIKYEGTAIATDFDKATSWAHTYTEEADPRQDVCVSCHRDRTADVSESNPSWLFHSVLGRVSRGVMDSVEKSQLNHVAGATDPLNNVCKSCHLFKLNFKNRVACNSVVWKLHVPTGAVSQSVWESVSTQQAGGTCGF